MTQSLSRLWHKESNLSFPFDWTELPGQWKPEEQLYVKKISVCPSVLCSITRNVFPWRWLARYLTVHCNVFKQSGRCVQTFIYPDDLDSRYWHTASCTASHTRTWYLLSAKILCLCVSCVLCCCSGAYTESSWAFYILSTSACYSHIKISHQFHSTGRFKSPIPDDSC